MPEYAELEADVELLGSKLVNSYRQHRYVADLGNWTPDFADVTPETWRLGCVPKSEPGPFVVKGATNSRKDAWRTMMYAQGRAELAAVADRLQLDPLIGPQGLYVRKYVELKRLVTGVDGMPIGEEYRFFVCDGQVLSGGFYWSSHAEDVRDACGSVPDAGCVPRAFVADAVKRVGERIRFWVLDVARCADGGWIVVELNDGTMSGLSENDPDVLYRNLRTVLDGGKLADAGWPPA